MDEGNSDISLGVGDGRGNLYVHGSYEAIKTCQDKLLALGKARTRLRKANCDYGDGWIRDDLECLVDKEPWCGKHAVLYYIKAHKEAQGSLMEAREEVQRLQMCEGMARDIAAERDRYTALAERRKEQARVEESDLRMVAAHLELLDRPGVSDYLVDALLIMRRVLAARAAIEEKKHG